MSFCCCCGFIYNRWLIPNITLYMNQVRSSHFLSGNDALLVSCINTTSLRSLYIFTLACIIFFLTSATSLPTKSRITTYSPFFSLHHSWFSETFFFLVLLFLSSKISTFRRYETVELSPYNPTPQRELKSGLKSHEFNARLQWAKPESEDGGG